jgi:hypothetical protein
VGAADLDAAADAVVAGITEDTLRDALPPLWF